MLVFPVRKSFTAQGKGAGDWGLETGKRRVQWTDEAMRIFGAYGYSMEYPVQRYYRDNRFLLNGGGTHEILQANIARWVSE